jgi:hypothetical protein
VEFYEPQSGSWMPSAYTPENETTTLDEVVREMLLWDEDDNPVAMDIEVACVVDKLEQGTNVADMGVYRARKVEEK